VPDQMNAPTAQYLKVDNVNSMKK